jgi:hypothetical protein
LYPVPPPGLTGELGRGEDQRVTLAQRAAAEHRAVINAIELAAAHRERRDALVRELRATDPEHWTYRRISDAVGISPELAAKIVQGRT